MDEGTILQGLVRIGTVSSVDRTRRMARVIYRDMDDLTSGWLHVLQQGTGGFWLPEVNACVLVLYLPVFNGDGFILGVI